MRTTSTILLAMLFFIIGCNKEGDESREDIIPIEQENHIKAKVDGRDVIIYQDNSLNTDTTSYFSFSFGQSILSDEEQADTSFYISGYLNGEQLKINFPMESHANTYDIVRDPNPASPKYGYYSYAPTLDENQGFLVFQTQNFLKEAMPAQKVGEVSVKVLDWEKREISGTFFFTAYGYYHDWNEEAALISPVDSLVQVNDGTFYFKWEKDLDISL